MSSVRSAARTAQIAPSQAGSRGCPGSATAAAPSSRRHQHLQQPLSPAGAVPALSSDRSHSASCRAASQRSRTCVRNSNLTLGKHSPRKGQLLRGHLQDPGKCPGKELDALAAGCPERGRRDGLGMGSSLPPSSAPELLLTTVTHVHTASLRVT